MLDDMEIRAVVKFWDTCNLILHTCGKPAVVELVLTSGNFTHNIKGSSSIISCNRCCGLLTLMTAREIDRENKCRQDFKSSGN